MNINKINGRIEQLHKIEQDISVNQKRKIYIWGCSETARMLTEFCSKNSTLVIEAYVVDDIYYNRDFFMSKKVIKASVWKEIVCKGDYILFGFTSEETARKKEKEIPAGVNGFYLCFPYSANAYGECLTYEQYQKHKTEFEDTYKLLADEKSKKTMEAFVNACISGELEEIDSLREDNQYFNSLTQKCKVGMFIDLGAYVGDTIEKAFMFYGNQIEKAVAFEPDLKNICIMEDRMRKGGMEDKLILVKKGSWSGEGSLFFSSSDSSSSISENGDIRIDVDSVDNILENENTPVSYIKMDVEGSEKESLLGSQKVISKYQPLIAVCVYHRPEDLCVLPKMIREMTKGVEYRYYLRYHGPDLRELVLYAIPEDNYEKELHN